MPNGNEICANCGRERGLHVQCGPDLRCTGIGGAIDFKKSWRYVVSTSLLDKVRALCDEADNYDLLLCSCCKRINPQHKDCTSCNDRDDLMKSLTTVREALAEIDRVE